MTKRDVCDRCLAVNVNQLPYTQLEIRLGLAIDGVVQQVTNRADVIMTICPECQPVVESVIANRIMLTSTPADVKHGAMFDKSSPVLKQTIISGSDASTYDRIAPDAKDEDEEDSFVGIKKGDLQD